MYSPPVAGVGCSGDWLSRCGGAPRRPDATIAAAAELRRRHTTAVRRRPAPPGATRHKSQRQQRFAASRQPAPSSASTPDDASRSLCYSDLQDANSPRPHTQTRRNLTVCPPERRSPSCARSRRPRSTTTNASCIWPTSRGTSTRRPRPSSRTTSPGTSRSRPRTPRPGSSRAPSSASGRPGSPTSSACRTKPS